MENEYFSNIIKLLESDKNNDFYLGLNLMSIYGVELERTEFKSSASQFWCKYNLWDDELLVNFYQDLIYFHKTGISLDKGNLFLINKAKKIAKAEKEVFKIIKEKIKNSKVEILSKDQKRITNVYIHSYFDLKNIVLFEPTCSSFIAISGENAQGKTLLLQAIASTIEQKYSLNSPIVIGVAYKGKIVQTIESLESKGVLTIGNAIKSSEILAYGTSRLLIQTPESMDANQRNSNVDSLFRSDISLLNIEYWLKMRLLADEKDKVGKVLDLLKILMPHITKVSYRKDQKEGVVFEYEEDGKSVRLEQLSAGQKSIVAFIGDMIIRLWEQQPEIEQISDLEGIVIIDEIEAHLHPKWQRMFPKLLHETFPKVQFIVTTHSPMPILGMPKDTALFNVTKDKGIQVERLELDIENMSPQQLLTSPLFGLESVRSLYSGELKDFYTEETYQEIIKRKEVQERIKELAKKFELKKNKEEDDSH